MRAVALGRRSLLGLFLSGLLAVVIALGAFLPRPGATVGDVPVCRVARAPFVRRVPAQGNLRAVHATPVAVPLGASGPYRLGWLAPDGARVRAGDVVVRFDASDLTKQLNDAQADARSTGLKIDKQRVESQAEISNLDRTAALEREALESSSRFAKKDGTIYSRSEIIESQVDQQLAQEKEAHARGAAKTEQRLAGTELDLLAIERRKAELKIHTAEQALGSLEVRAPHDGVLVLKRDFRGDPVHVGDSVWNGQPLAEIPDLAAMEAEVYVLEADAGGLAPGKRAAVVLESQPDVVYPAVIQRVDSLAKPRLRGSPVQYFAVTLALARTDPQLMKPGQRVRALLSLDDRRDALAVPRQAVFEREGKMVVYRRGRQGRGGAGEGFAPVEVALGPANAGRVVVERGLSPGDTIALVDPTRPARPPGEDTGAAGAKKEGAPAAPAARPAAPGPGP